MSQSTFIADTSIEDASGEVRFGNGRPERPRLTVTQALLRNWLWALIPALVLAAAGVAVGFSRRPTYTSEARLAVGKADPASAGFGGDFTAFAGEATVYSRSVTAPPIVAAIGQRLHLRSNVVSARLTATPVQDTPIIRVIGTGPTAASAEQIANVAASQLTQYVTATNRTNPDATRLLALYHAGALARAQVSSDLNSAQRALNSNPANVALKQRVASDTARVSALDLQLTALNQAYINAFSSEAETKLISPLSSASSASSNRSSMIQTLGGAGLLAGLLIGIALAVWRADALLRGTLYT
jgi:capsular polysaccharide biosynthesis protein